MADAAATDSGPPPSLRHRFEALLAGALIGVFSRLPIATASAIAGGFARTVGPLLPVTRRARSNLARAMPELNAAETDRVIRAMWDNFGRYVGEMVHLGEFTLAPHADTPGTIEVVGTEHLKTAQAHGGPILLFAGHIANWDMQPLATHLLGVHLHVVYRAANNPLVDAMIKRMRGPLARSTVAKGPTGARELLKLLKQGEPIGMLVDQKMNNGIAVPFFGRPAMTAPALAQLALKFQTPVIPVFCERLGGPRFRVTYEAPLPLPATGNRDDDVLTLMTTVNAKLEDWIRCHPEHWLWLHRRWPD
jgi:KDO2-lipid IV(A) lauroyltransferase